MSIATDEAEKYFPTQYWPHMEPKGDYRGKECYIEGVKSSDIQEAYEQGRTAEPTEAELWAMARVIQIADDDADGSYTSQMSDDEWERFKSSYDNPTQCTVFRFAMRAYEASRKVVSE